MRRNDAGKLYIVRLFFDDLIIVSLNNIRITTLTVPKQANVYIANSVKVLFYPLDLSTNIYATT